MGAESDQPKLWGRLRATSVGLLVAIAAALLWRQLRPPAADVAGDGRFALVLTIGAAALAGAVLVGAKLATAPAGARPSLREMLVLVLGLPVLAMLAFEGVNRLGGGPEQLLVAPVLETRVEDDGAKRTYRVRTLAPDGDEEWFDLAVGVPPSEQSKWADFGGLRPGACIARRWRTGVLALVIERGWTPSACPRSAGEPPPDGLLLVRTGDRAGDWSWDWPMLAEGPGFEAWKAAVMEVTDAHLDRLDGRSLTFRVRVALDGTVLAAHAEGVPGDLGDELAATLMGRVDVIALPKHVRGRGQPAWGLVPARISWRVPTVQPPGNSNDESP